MTDNEIIKAVECDTYIGCEYCPYFRKNCNGIIDDEVSAKDVLDLINRQKAEIERWKDKARAAFLINLNEEEKAEAVKFLFNRLIDISVCKDNGDGTERRYDREQYKKGYADGAKEFSERLQNRCNEQQGCLWSSDIGAVLEEMVGAEK